MSKECWFEVVVPLLALRETCTIAISTVSPAPDNHVTDLIEREVFDVWQISLVCEDCKRAGVTEKCDHMAHLVPNWQSEDNRDLVKKIYGTNDADKFAREAQGIIKQPSLACFQADQVHDLFTKSGFVLDCYQRYVFMAIDPSGGSIDPETTVSDFALITGILPGVGFIGMEAIPSVNMSSWETRLILHIRMVMSNPYLTRSKLVIFVEGNMSTEAMMIRKLIWEYFPEACFPGTLGDEKVGILTTGQTKYDQQHIFQLALAKGDIRVARDLITTDNKPGELLTKLRTQLINWSKFAVPGKTPLQATRYTFTGKGTSRKNKDDLAMVAQLLLLCIHKFFSSPAWLKYQ